MKLITAFTNRSFGIGNNNNMPWSIPEDMRRFSNITSGNTIVMGRKTWESIGSKPLKDRFNIVVSSCTSTEDYNQNVVFVNESTLNYIDSVISYGDIYIIGGAQLYKKYVGDVDEIYATVIEQDYACDTFFPTEKLHEYHINYVSPQLYSTSENCNYRFINYKKNTFGKKHEEFQYLDILKEILYSGEARPDRTGVGTLSVFGKQMKFDISKSVPLITTKQLAWKTVIKELLWFLRGSSDSTVLEEQGVTIWKGNTSREFLDARGLNEYCEGDTGPLYSHSFRHFGAEYKGCKESYKGQGVDQIKNLIDGLKNDPYSRRHVLTTYDPENVDKCVLMPCHGIAIQFYVNGEDADLLSCHVYCRSSDSFLGLPFNIASYAVLTYVIAKLCNMKPNKLVISTGDTHIYSNHVEQVRAQLSRNPIPFPILTVSDSICNKNIEDITIKDFTLDGYVSYGNIKAPMAV